MHIRRDGMTHTGRSWLKKEYRLRPVAGRMQKGVPWEAMIVWGTFSRSVLRRVLFILVARVT